MTDFVAESLPVPQQAEQKPNLLNKITSAVARRKTPQVNLEVTAKEEQAQTDSSLRRLRLKMSQEKLNAMEAQTLKSARMKAGMQYARDYRAKQLAKKSEK